ncbi:MAG: hypothetical protein CMN73_09020 [Sphingomonas sp.]|nr:hypothetical protein [Sphingomonas sp.]|tara:strand:+ start:565 stop:1023 length:459 start_codon:yes stop_codon:yes gene_type:complete
MRPILAPLAALTLILPGCQQQASELEVKDAWVKLPAVSENPGAAYFTITGGGEDSTLVGVTAPFAVRAEMHESMKMDGQMANMMTMKPVTEVQVPAGETITFAPGGKHVMVYDIGPEVKSGDTVPLRLSFAGRDPIEVQAKVLAAGDPAPQP